MTESWCPVCSRKKIGCITHGPSCERGTSDPKSHFPCFPRAGVERSHSCAAEKSCLQEVQSSWHVSCTSFVWILFYFPKRQATLLLLGPCLVDLKSNSARWNSAGLVQLVTRSGYGLPSFRVFDISELPTSSVTYGFLANQGNTWLGRATYRHELKNCHQAEVKTKPPVPGNTVNSMTAGDFVSMYSIHSSKI